MSYATGDPLLMRLEIAPGADLTAAPSGYTWTDITSSLAGTGGLTLVQPVVSTVGAGDAESETNSSLSFTLNNPTGRFTTDFPASDLYPLFDIGCPIRWSIDTGDGSGWRVVQIAYLVSAEDEWVNMTPNLCRTHVTAAGSFRRLGKGKIESPLYRIGRLSNPVAMWSLEEGTRSTSANSAIESGAPMVRTSGTVNFGASSTPPPGSLPLADFGQGLGAFSDGSIEGTFNAGFNPVGGVNSWSVEFVVNFADTVTAGNIIVPVQIFFGPGDLEWIKIAGETAGDGGAYYQTKRYGAPSDGVVPTLIGVDDGLWHHLRLEARQNGSAMDFVFWYDGAIASTSSFSPYTLTMPNKVVINPFASSDDGVPFIGHLRVNTPAAIDLAYNAMIGWVGEMAHDRIFRLCVEEEIPTSITATSSAAMGPQPIARVLDILRDCASTDHGILTDHLGVVGYRALGQLVNQTPLLVINGGGSELFAPFTPVRDDQERINTARATRPGGGASPTIIDAVDVARAGTYDKDVQVNISADAQLADHAGYVVALGTVPGKRYAAVTLRHHVNTNNLTEWLSMTLGDELSISSPPRQHAPGTIELQVRGWAQTWGPRRREWRVEMNTIRADAFLAFVLDTDRLETPSSELLASIGTTGNATIFVTPFVDAALTQMLITSAANAGEFPVDVVMGGEKLLLTTVSNTPITDAFTRTTSNGWGSIPASGAISAQAWTPDGSTSDHATTGTAATHSLPVANTYRFDYLANLFLINPDVQVTWSLAVTAAGGTLEPGGLCLRRASGTDTYLVRCSISTAQAITIQMYAPSGTQIGTYATGITHSAGQQITLRYRCVGNRHQAKAWITSGSQPAAWQLDVVDAERVTGGNIQVRSGVGAGNSNTKPVVCTMDNFIINNVQTAGTTRSQNGVVKAHSYGSLLTLWQPRGLAM